MLEKLVAELKAIVEDIKSPFSYIHDKLVASVEEVHAEVERLKARIEALENVAPVEAPPPAPTERVSYPKPTYFMEDGSGEKVEATAEDLASPQLALAAFFVKHPDGTFTQLTQLQINTPAE